MSNNNYNQTLKKCLRILEILAKGGGDIKLLPLSREINLNKSTVYRILSTLVKMGYVEKNLRNNEYSLGLNILKLARPVLNRLDIREVAKPFMEELMKKSGETVRLAILNEGEVVYIEQVIGNNPIKLSMQIGSHFPAHSTGAGKILLAYLPEEKLDLIIKKNGLNSYTPNTITDIQKLKKCLEEVLLKGCAYNDGEFREGIRDIAAPIFDYNGNLIGSITVVGPSSRLKGTKIERTPQLVKATAKKISKRLGYSGRENKWL